ncbi:PAS domain S-box-containing protein [Rhodobacteraceae bacterium MBR-64]
MTGFLNHSAVNLNESDGGAMIKVAQEKAEAALDDLRSFEARNSPDGLFLRYCRGRVRGFVVRQGVTALGAVALAVFFSPMVGILAALLALIGDWVDSLAADRIWRRHASGTIPGRVPAAAKRLAVLTAGFQAITIAACIVFSWVFVPFQDGRFFAVAFLIGTAINAGVVRPFFRAGADMRLAIYALTLIGVVVHDVTLRDGAQPMSPGNGFFLVGAAMLALVTVTFVLHLSRMHRVRTGFEHDLLREKHQLALARAAERQDERQSRMLALVAKHANDGVFITDPEGKIEWVNDTFTRLTGYAPQEAIGNTPGDLLYNRGVDPDTVARVSKARDERTPLRIEIPSRTKAGALMWLESSLTPIFAEDGDLSMTIAIVRDITDAKDREAELARARAEAESAAQTKSQFLAAMSHEIRTPMNGVIATAELLSTTQMTEDQALYVDTIVESGRALLTIINDVLDLSRLQSGNPVIHAVPFDLGACVAGVVNLLRPEAGKKALSFRVHCPDALPWVVGDDGRIRQILINLIGNGIKFTSEGEVTIRVAPRPQPGGRVQVSISVADTGIGIAPDRIDRIFDSFTQADGEISRRYGGTGLGLTISRLLARQMGGDITVSSEPGRGTCFVLSLDLPMAEGAAAREEDAQVAPARARRRQGGEPGHGNAAAKENSVILVAEDNRTNAFIVDRMLAAPGRVLHFAADGAAAVALFRTVRPDIVLMDVSMPVMDGLEATRTIRRIEAEDGARGHCPVIALTANAFDDDRADCLNAGCDDFLTKPVAKADLVAMVMRYESPVAAGHLDGTADDRKTAGTGA